MREAAVARKTAETDINLYLNLDDPSICEIRTGAGFLDHMLTLFARHGNIGLRVICTGDTEVDYHHTTEDIGIALGDAFSQALGNKAGIRRYGDILLPMDEALVLCAIDLSGRGELRYSLTIPAQKVGDFDTELIKEFFLGFVRRAGAALHLRQLDGENSHHIIEAAFKAFGRAAAQAVSIEPGREGQIPSTKGTLA